MEKVHQAATDHLPAFITAPGHTDMLMVVSGIFLIATVLGVGVFFLWLHSLPERMVHNKLQYDLVAVLALLSLFTHVHAFWIAALLLAFISFPDMSRFDILRPLHSIARSLRTLADRDDGPSMATPPPADDTTNTPAASGAAIAKEA